MLGDYFFVYKRKMPVLEDVTLKPFRLAPVLGYVVGTIVAYVTDKAGFGIPPLFGIVVAMICVPLFDKLLTALKVNDRHTVNKNAKYV